jgi:diguanylate cyclase (GGDEF)-like protein
VNGIEGTRGLPRLLLVEERPEQLRQLAEWIGRMERLAFSVETSAGLADAKRRSVRETFDLVLAGLPEAEGRPAEAAFRALHSLSQGAPVLLLVDLAGEPLAVKAVHRGAAQDYLVRGFLTPELLEQALRYALERRRMLAELRRARQREHGPASTDALTSLPNRQVFYDRLAEALAVARPQSRMVAVLLLHLEGFKLVHSTLGPSVGDPLLRAIAERATASLAPQLRGGDTVARLSGDEFAVVLADVAGMGEVSRAAEGVLEAFGRPVVLEGHEFFISTSIGVSVYPFDGSDAETLVRHADLALRRSVEQGGNAFQFYLPAVNQQFLTRLELQNNLRMAIARDEFVLHYMPQLEVSTGRVRSLEALVRWKHPTLGLVQPGDFIPVAEETGLILPIGERVLREACAQARAWSRSGLPPIRVSVNVSARQFQHQNPAALVARAIHESGLEPGNLILEITESAVMREADAALAVLRSIKEAGVRVAIDDFGTGYSSLSYLRSFPIDALKIDRSFVRELASRPDDEAIVTAIIAMARSLRLDVIAEGVESHGQMEWLRARGCDEVQGYLISRPLPAGDVPAFLRRTG